MFNINLETITNEGVPYQKFLDSIKNPLTMREYTSTLGRFLREVPPRIYRELGCNAPDDTVESQAECFVKLCQKNPQAGTNIIAEYIKYLSKKAERGEISPNTVRHHPKGIKLLLDTNDTPLHWKRLYHLFPRPANSQDRAYTRAELQKMMNAANTITEKVILVMFSSAGFRVESWDYFTWRDVTFFKNEDGSFKGAALLVYRGDPESYWTFITPEACDYLEQYREKWRKDIGEYPKPDQPLLKATDRLGAERLNQKGVKRRVQNMAESAGLRPPLPPGRTRHAVMLDHGFRKYFNTMLRRAKVNYLDKEDMMGHKVGLEKNYERYVEEDFERFPEYQKAIPFLTISNDERFKKQVAESQEMVKQIQKEQLTENDKLLQELGEFKELAKKLKEAGIIESLKNTGTCNSCSCTFVGESCHRCM